VYDALLAALRESPRRVLAEVERSDERGRGGGGFPTGAKWRAAAAAPGPRVVVANGDEGDPGSYVDRMLLEEDPHTVLEGLALCAFAVGAEEGVLFIRSEYPRALRRMREAVAEAEVEGLVGANAARPFRVRVASGFGSYVGGEETALLETLEGRAGEVRLRPPYPVERGLLGRPTVVNNVETLAVIPWIVTHGGDAYRRLGTAASSGTKALCLNAGFRRPGIVEIELGRSLRRVIEGEGGTRPEELEAILLGGPMGSLLFEDEWDVPLCYEALAQRGVRLGHGGLVAVPRGIDWRTWLVQGLEYMARESCGKCVPCREGSRRARDAVGAGACSGETLDALLACIEQTSLCGFGRGAPGPLRKLVARRPDAVTS
jgi:NADH-quinone oxidoreductase subunit F